MSTFSSVSKDNVQAWVREAFKQNQAAVGVGVYGDERVSTFFVQLKRLVNKSLQLSLKSNYNDALRLIVLWGSDVQQSELQQCKVTYPDIEEDYKMAMVSYVQSKYRGSHSNLKLKIPSFATFYRDFYREIAQTADVENKSYFQTYSYTDRELFLRDIFYLVVQKHAQLVRHQENKKSTTAASFIDDYENKCPPRVDESVSQVVPRTKKEAATDGFLTQEYLDNKRSKSHGLSFADPIASHARSPPSGGSTHRSASRHSRAPSQAPSRTPSRAPSRAPSRVPSRVPSRAPSIGGGKKQYPVKQISILKPSESVCFFGGEATTMSADSASEIFW